MKRQQRRVRRAAGRPGAGLHPRGPARPSSYLHDLGLVYCDFKPDNLIQVGDAVKLIDLGGVRRIDDEDSAIFGTVGYQAPEVAEVGPSVASRHLHDRAHPGGAVHGVPRLPGHLPAHAAAAGHARRCSPQHDSLYRLIAKCCAADPADRFASADELRSQLLGVLREVVAARTTGTALTSAARCCSRRRRRPPRRCPGRSCRACGPTPTDPQHAWLTSIGSDRPGAAARTTWSRRPEDSAEVLLARAHAHLELRRARQGPRDQPPQLLAEDPWEWRALWIDGLAAMQQEDWDAAKAVVQRGLPAGARRARAQAGARRSPARTAACPTSPRASTATCAATDAAYAAPAAFGMARVRAGRQDTAGRRRRARPGAVDQPRLPGEPPAARRRAARRVAASTSPCSTRRCTSIESVRMDPADRAALHGPDPHPGARRGDRPSGPTAGRARRSAATRPRRTGSATGSRRPTGRWPATPRPRRPGRAGQPGQRRTQLDAGVTATAPEPCPSLRQPHCGEPGRASFCESCGKPLDAAGGADGPSAPANAAPRRARSTTSAAARSVRRPSSPRTAGAAAAGATAVPELRRRGRAGRLLRVVRRQGAQRARPLPRAARVVGRGRVRPGHPAPPQRGRDGAARVGGARWQRAVLVVLDGVSNTIDSARRLAGRREGRARGAADAAPARDGHRREPPGRASPRSSPTRPRAANDAVVARDRDGVDQPRRRRRTSWRCSRAACSATPTSATRVSTGCPTAGPACSSASTTPRPRSRSRPACPGPRRESSPQAHAITRGSAATRPTSRRASVQLRARRAGLAAGLLRRAVELRLRARRARRPDRAPPGPTEPAALALALVGFANAQGGQDNITVDAGPGRGAGRAECDHRTEHAPEQDQGSHMAEFTATVYQNEFLPDGGTDVNAIVTVDLLRGRHRRPDRQGRRRRDHHRRHVRLDGHRRRWRPPSRRPRRRSPRSSTAPGSP